MHVFFICINSFLLILIKLFHSSLSLIVRNRFKMGPKPKPAAGPSKKTEQKKKDKVIEVGPFNRVRGNASHLIHHLCNRTKHSD